ncbi:hypothetical protein [Streptomyces sp. NPDC003393]
MGEGKDPNRVLDIKTADIKRAAPDFHKGTEDLSKALTVLVKSLDGLGEPWGHAREWSSTECEPGTDWSSTRRTETASSPSSP